MLLQRDQVPGREHWLGKRRDGETAQLHQADKKLAQMLIIGPIRVLINKIENSLRLTRKR